MPNEPDNPVEEQLKAWAAARREEAGGPFELHPATRRMLQDEVARSFPTPEPERDRGPGWLALLRPRLAFALSVVAAMIVVGVALWPSRSPSALQSGRLLADRGEKEGPERPRLISDKAELPAEPAGVLVSSANRDVPPPAVAATALAINVPAQSVPLSRADRFGEARQTFDAPSGTAKNARELLERRDAAASAPSAREEKAKEITLAKDTTQLSGQDASGASRRPEAAAEQFGFKPTDAAGRGGAEVATVGGRSGDQALTLRSGGPASKAAGQRALAAATPPADSVLVEKESVLNYQKTQAVVRLEARAAIPEADRLQASNAPRFFSLATGSATQQFTQAVRYRRNFNSPPPPKVLTSFKLEQQGRQLRIVDADGSVYEGGFIAEAGGVAAASLADEKLGAELKKADVPGQAGLAVGAAEGGQKANFRVEGTNRTLNLPLVFTGNLWAPDQDSAAGAVGETPQRGAVLLQQSNASRTPSPQNLPRVQGQATIGNDRVEINAVPVGP